MMDLAPRSNQYVSRSHRRRSTPTDGYSRWLGSGSNSYLYCIFWSGAAFPGKIYSRSGSKGRGVDRQIDRYL